MAWTLVQQNLGTDLGNNESPGAMRWEHKAGEGINRRGARSASLSTSIRARLLPPFSPNFPALPPPISERESALAAALCAVSVLLLVGVLAGGGVAFSGGRLRSDDADGPTVAGAVRDPESVASHVMLLGHSDSYLKDKAMQVTIAFNHFGEGLIQRMPRCRHGYFHVVNNDYTHWEMYAIGGSAEPTINSQGNRYLAPTNPFAKEVTKRVETAQTTWKGWNWRSEGDLLLNGAFFTPSGAGASASYSHASSLGAKSSSMVGTITSGAGVLSCHKGSSC